MTRRNGMGTAAAATIFHMPLQHCHFEFMADFQLHIQISQSMGITRQTVHHMMVPRIWIRHGHGHGHGHRLCRRARSHGRAWRHRFHGWHGWHGRHRWHRLCRWCRRRVRFLRSFHVLTSFICDDSVSYECPRANVPYRPAHLLGWPEPGDLPLVPVGE
jgi:hypothetical protein